MAAFPAPRDVAPALEVAPARPELLAVRETIDLLERDLVAMIRGVTDAADGVQVGARASVEVLGAIRGRSEALAAKSQEARRMLGLHLEFFELPDEAKAALLQKLEVIRAENSVFIDRAVDAAARISRLFEGAVSRETLSEAQLFDTNYVPIPGTNPQQYRSQSLDWLETVLPGIQEPLHASDPRMVFCAAVDRNAYLPVHNAIYSKLQRAGDLAWNVAHCRNRRIFDDRAGLSAARNTRPFLIQSYARDMGNGNTVMMREIDAPIRVHGKHWGGFRSAYTF